MELTLARLVGLWSVATGLATIGYCVGWIATMHHNLPEMVVWWRYLTAAVAVTMGLTVFGFGAVLARERKFVLAVALAPFFLVFSYLSGEMIRQAAVFRRALANGVQLSEVTGTAGGLSRIGGSLEFLIVFSICFGLCLFFAKSLGRTRLLAGGMFLASGVLIALTMVVVSNLAFFMLVFPLLVPVLAAVTLGLAFVLLGFGLLFPPRTAPVATKEEAV